jgi:hypothetical protein
MLTERDQELRDAAEADFETFIRLNQPLRVLGSIHKRYIRFITREDKKSHLLVLLPRDHQKSAIAGLYAAWRLTKNPAIRILYISSTSNLATKQLKFIKDILTSDIYRAFWPEMINIDEAKREKWTESEISVDHPLRKQQYVRDPSVFTAGLTTSVTGLHCDLTIMDDVVVYENAYTHEGRAKTELQYSLLASIEGADAEQLVVGTRYDPNDLYNTIQSKVISIFNENGEIIGEEPLYEVFQEQVENRGDGTGEFLWPRQQASNGQWFGFNAEILAKKRALYAGNDLQYYAQYYNNPNLGENAGIPRKCFQYYDKSFVNFIGGHWHFKGNRLNIFAAMDFSYTANKKSDYSTIVVVGCDYLNNFYVLDIDRFQTGLLDEYYRHLFQMHSKWGFHEIIAETTAAQEVIVNDLKLNYIRPNGLGLSVKAFKPHKYQGAKEERMEAVLQPRYNNGQMWHYLGGNCQILEDELILRKPPHDDVKDALTTAISACIPPVDIRMHNYNHYQLDEHSHRRFGGIS